MISGEAALLFASDFSQVLWANAIGAELVGGDNIFNLLDIELSPNHSVVRQLKNAAIQIEGAEPINRGFRLAHGLKSELIQAEISKITLPNDTQAVLVVFEGNHKSSRLKEHELAEMAVEALDGFADAAAIVDEYGLVLASTKGFDRLEIDPDTLEALLKIVANEDDRLVKRKVETGSGALAAAGLGRIRDRPGRYLIVIADTGSAETIEARETSELSTSSQGFNANTREVSVAESVALAESKSVSEPLPDMQPSWAESSNVEKTQELNLPPSEKVFTEEVTEEDLPVTPINETAQGSEKPARNNGSLLDRWYFTEETEAKNTEHEAIDAEEAAMDDLPPEQSVSNTEVAEKTVNTESPLRFAFSIDNNQIVQSVSPELAQAVGMVSGDILGKDWATISKARKFDESNVILDLLRKADTWSGKSVLWPVDDTDMVIPVDLAALPVFDRERNFDGFRGFGIIRVNDAIVDPSGVGFTISDIASDEPVDQMSIDRQSNLEDVRSEADSASYWKTDLGADSADEKATDEKTDEFSNAEADVFQRLPGNVFRLPQRETVAPKEEEAENELLSGKEQRAFSEISKSLADQIEEEHLEPGNQKEEVTSESEEVSAASHYQADELLKTDDSILESLPVALVIYQSGKTLFANTALLEMTGYASTDELADAGGVDVLLGQNSDDKEDHLDSSTVLVLKDGCEKPVQSKLTSVDWHGEKALCLTFSDIPANASTFSTQAEESEKAVLDMARVTELENILETAADGILIIDQDGKIESLNASGEALFGRSQRDVVGQSFGKLFATESREALEAYIKDLNSPGVSSVLNQGQQVIGLEANGGLIPLFATIGRVGRSDRYCAVLRDLTEWKKSEEELVTAKRNAETASEQKTEFLSRISHEIREPLTAIIGFSDVMIEERFGKIDNERYREYLKDINRSGVHVLDLVNDLLDISKIEAGKLELSYEAVDLNQLAAETVALLQPQANNKRILIRTSLSRAVPKVVADARSIRQIILNLVSNAINHSPTNSQVIVSTTYEENSEVGLRIRDTGAGMNESELRQALEPFAQVGEDRNSGGGSGLGLPLTKALVEANRAYFELESTPGEGTIAHIQFPSQRVLAD
ncbi:MAG: PAS domain S-box protein [Salaquimonas sp.]